MLCMSGERGLYLVQLAGEVTAHPELTTACPYTDVVRHRGGKCTPYLSHMSTPLIIAPRALLFLYRGSDIIALSAIAIIYVLPPSLQTMLCMFCCSLSFYDIPYFPQQGSAGDSNAGSQRCPWGSRAVVELLPVLQDNYKRENVIYILWLADVNTPINWAVLKKKCPERRYKLSISCEKKRCCKLAKRCPYFSGVRREGFSA